MNPLPQAVKQDLSEVFAVYLSFATELEDQSKQLLEKLEEASLLHGCYRDEVQSKYQKNTIRNSSGQDRRLEGPRIHAGRAKVSLQEF